MSATTTHEREALLADLVADSSLVARGLAALCQLLSAAPEHMPIAAGDLGVLLAPLADAASQAEGAAVVVMGQAPAEAAPA
jgi:hypothetical protein